MFPNAYGKTKPLLSEICLQVCLNEVNRLLKQFTIMCIFQHGVQKSQFIVWLLVAINAYKRDRLISFFLHFEKHYEKSSPLLKLKYITTTRKQSYESSYLKIAGREFKRFFVIMCLSCGCFLVSFDRFHIYGRKSSIFDTYISIKSTSSLQSF